MAGRAVAATVSWKTRLFFGDNLDVLRRYIPNESVDLVYLDPPFNSNASCNVLFAEKTGTRSAAQIKAFELPTDVPEPAPCALRGRHSAP